ncbi:MAG: RnfABCDGE type electron transport complex subunit D [Spirochaetaceae bacterium]|nr:RnfABCDGE type electron transport complex subunit D [Spirochaetaceae bacterium]
MAANEHRTKLLLLQSSPHIVRKDDVPMIMSRVVIALVPVTVFGVFNFGISALLNVAVSVASAVIGEALFRRITKQELRIKDCSALVSGLLLALVIPPSTPLWMTALGSLFAVIVAKELFGGIGANVFNPALAGRAFLLMSFPAALTTWVKPGGIYSPFYQFAGSGIVDGATTATPLGIAKVGLDGISGVTQLIAEMTGGRSITQTLFLGTHAGCIGETSILLILLGGVFLLVTKTIDWRAPAAMIASGFIASAAFGMGPLSSLLSGGLVFGAVFMCTDYTTTPVSSAGKLIFGLGAGLITIVIRKYGNYPEGVMFSILIMNACTPFLNKLLRKKYGFVPVKKPAVGGAK